MGIAKLVGVDKFLLLFLKMLEVSSINGLIFLKSVEKLVVF
jgi:hypothetical protein